MNSSTVAAFVSMMHSISTFPAASLTAIEVLAWCTSMPIYFLLSIWVLLSVGSEPTPPAYAERGALFYNALTGERGGVFSCVCQVPQMLGSPGPTQKGYSSRRS